MDANNQSYSAGVPRKIADLMNLQNELLEKNMKVNSRDEAELISAEWFESQGKFHRKATVKCNQLDMWCSDCDKVFVKWRRRRDKFVLVDYEKDHNCGGALAPTSLRYGSCAYIIA